MMHQTIVAYTLPVRQVLFLLSICVATPVLIITSAVAGLGVWGVVLMSLACMILIPWVAIRHSTGLGEMSLSEDGIKVVPLRWTACYGRREISLAFTDITSAAQVAATTGDYAWLKSSCSPRAITMTGVKGNKAVPNLIVSAIQTFRRRNPDLPPLREDSPQNSLLWKFVASAGLAVLILSTIAIFVKGRASDLELWLRVAYIACLIVPFSFITFRK